MLFLDKYCLAIIQYAVIVIKIIRIGLLVEKRRQVGCESDHSSRTRHRDRLAQSRIHNYEVT